MFRGSVKGTGYPFHSPVSPSLPLPFVTVSYYISTGVYPYRRRKLLFASSRQSGKAGEIELCGADLHYPIRLNGVMLN